MNLFKLYQTYLVNGYRRQACIYYLLRDFRALNYYAKNLPGIPINFLPMGRQILQFLPPDFLNVETSL